MKTKTLKQRGHKMENQNCSNCQHHGESNQNTEWNWTDCEDCNHPDSGWSWTSNDHCCTEHEE